MSLSLLSRREFLQLALATPVLGRRLQAAGLTLRPALPQVTGAADDPWLGTARILARITAPVFPNRDVDMTRYKTINEAIDACSAAGGGRVVVPAGSFTTGPIRLKSKVNLHLSEGAVLKFSTDPKDYLPLVYTRYEGVELMNYSPLIYAYDAQDVAVTGRGRLDGQAGNGRWWDWKGQSGGRRRLMDPATATMPVADRIFGEGAFLRPNRAVRGISLPSDAGWTALISTSPCASRPTPSAVASWSASSCAT